MKKLLLLIITLLFVFTLSACGEDAPTLVEFNALETTVSDNDVSISALENELAALEASLATLDGGSDAQDLLIADILADITAILAEIDELQEVPLPLIINPNEVTEIVIAHTNDVHGRVNDDSWAGSIGMASIKNIMDALRDQHANTFLVDAGDIFHGTTFATLEEGESMVEVMNQVGYDLMVPGNHDFNYGQDRLLELAEMANFPLITANVQYAADDTDFMNPYYIQDFDGVLVGFFGLTTPETTYKTHPDNVIGLNFLNPIFQATAMVAELEPLVDIIILLGHIGIDENTAITSEDIALAVPGIDVIIDGHSHSILPDGLMVGDTLIVSTGEYMKNLGVFTLTVQNGEIIDHEVMLIDNDMIDELNYGYDYEVQSFIDALVADQGIILNEVVGQTAVELVGTRGDVRTGETNLGNLIADSMIIVTEADVAITNGGGIRSSIAAGDITLGNIITVLPFGNIIVTIELTGQELLDSLEHGTSAYPDAEGMFPHVAGMTFDINLSNAEGSRVENLMIGGVAVDLAAIYLVATNDFMAAGGDGYDIFAAKERVGEFKGLHEALTDMFTLGVDVEMPVMGRITVID